MGIVVLSSVVALALEPGWRSGVAHLLSLETLAHVRVLVESMGMWGPIFLMALMVLHSVTFVPSEILTIAAVALFGPVKGVIYSWVGSMLGAYLAFFMARGFGRPLVGRFVPSSVLKTFDDFVERRGVWGLVLLRLIPLVSFNALNYGAGLTKMTVWQFTWTTGLGILPAGILIAIVYQSAVEQRDAFVGLTVVALLITLAVVLRWKMRAR